MDIYTLGKFGEDLACKYLTNHNYQLLARNQRMGRLEIDIIATKSGLIYFFEIKTRIRNKETNTESPLAQKQIKNLKKAALCYAAIHKINTELINFDLIVILVNCQTNTALIKWYKNIF